MATAATITEAKGIGAIETLPPSPAALQLAEQALEEAENPSASDGGADEGLEEDEPHNAIALVSEIVLQVRRYDDLRRAKQRLELQMKAMCRHACDGDKVAGEKLYRKPDLGMTAWLLPYRAAMEPLDVAIKSHEKLLTKLGAQLPVAGWADGIAGLSPRFLALIVGECGIGPGEYRSPAALWKRMGMAVIDGGRQRRVTGDAAIEHGYVARRRALMWNIGESMLKQQLRNPKGEDGKPLGDAFAIGEFGALYLERKAHEATKADKPIIVYARAKRYIEKRLLRELWRAWRRGQMTRDAQEPAAPPPTSSSGEADRTPASRSQTPHPTIPVEEQADGR